MKILQITSDYLPKPLWGMGWHVSNIVTELNAQFSKEVDIYVATSSKSIGVHNNIITTKLSDDRKLLSNKEDEIFNNFGKFIEWNYCLAEEIIKTKKNFNIIHCHNWMSWITAKTIQKNSGGKIVSSLHFLQKQYEKMEENPVLNNHQQIVDIETEMINNSDAVICFNENQRKFLISNYQVSNKNIFVIAQGIFVPERSFEKKNEDTISITSVGRLTVDKGIIPLIKVFQKLSKKYKNLRLNIIGEGELFKTIKEMDVVGLNLYGYLNREKLFKVLKNSDIFCSLSISESFGLSVIEAMLLGVPPIFTSGNNLPIPFSDNKSGFYIPLVEDNGKFTVDMNILEDTLERLITNNKLRQKIGDNAYRQSRKKYSLISMATNTYKIYNSIQ